MKASAGKRTVLIVVENLPLPLDRRVWQESCALRDAGYEVIVICPRMRGYTAPEEIIEGIHIYRHWISEEAGGFRGFFREYASALSGEFFLAWRLWLRHRFSVIHICNPPDLLFLIAAPFKLFGIKIIYDVHDLWPEMFEAKFGRRGLFYWAVRIAERFTYACADVVMATNESVRTVAFERGKKRSSEVFIVRTAPKISGLETPPDASLKKGRPFLAAYIGVMGDADGVIYLIEAANHLVNQLGRKDIHFLLMGSGPEHDRLIKRRDELGLRAYIDLPGRVSNEFLFTALQTMDLGLSSDPKNSYNDGCTMNKVLEYMAFGKAQVMFDLVEGRASAGEAAVYVKENSAQKLAEAIQELMDNPDRRKEMGKFGQKRLTEDLNWNRSVIELLMAYQETV